METRQRMTNQTHCSRKIPRKKLMLTKNNCKNHTERSNTTGRDNPESLHSMKGKRNAADSRDQKEEKSNLMMSKQKKLMTAQRKTNSSMNQPVPNFDHCKPFSINPQNGANLRMKKSSLPCSQKHCTDAKQDVCKLLSIVHINKIWLKVSFRKTVVTGRKHA